MIINTGHQPPSAAAATIIPLAAGDALASTLERLAPALAAEAPMLQQDFKAEHGETLLLYRGQVRYLLLGLGAGPSFPEVHNAFRSLAHKYRHKLSSHLAIDLSLSNAEGQEAQWAEAAVNGLLLGSYQIGQFKNANHAAPHPLAHAESVLDLIAAASAIAECAQAARRGQQIAAAQLRILDLVNAPSNKKTAEDLAAWAVASAAAHGYAARVMDKAQIEATGLHALLAVNRGSELPPAFIILEYQPHKQSSTPLKKVGLVGKGVTFDTGGLSIKPSSNMHYMKSDMGGAAAVLGAIEAAARLQLPVHLVGIIPATDNCVDARSIKPSDVIDSYSGKTIEIIDTDAEGRLILADGLAYMVKNYAPEVLIDLATLTGSTVRTFGYHAAALFSNNDQLAALLAQAGDSSGERLWRLPIWEVYKDDIKSDVADVRNFSGKPMAGAISAAKFLEAFIEDHPAWAHLDIAGVAFGDSEFASQKSATAYGVRLLVEFLERYARHKNDE